MQSSYCNRCTTKYKSDPKGISSPARSNTLYAKILCLRNGCWAKWQPAVAAQRYKAKVPGRRRKIPSNDCTKLIEADKAYAEQPNLSSSCLSQMSVNAVERERERETEKHTNAPFSHDT